MNSKRSDEFAFEPTTKTIQDLVNHYESGQLELSPAFQRKSVWAQRDRLKLIDSIFSGYPLPSIFLYERMEGNRLKYDVIDGKQRLESILMFMGVLRGRYSVDLELQESEKEACDWKKLQRKGYSSRFLTYRIPVNIVRGELSHIVELFVRINSTGKALSTAEKRHAKYYNSQFLRSAGRIAERLAPSFIANKILSGSQIARMKHIELVCELMLTSHRKALLKKKAAIDAVMSSNDLTARQVRTCGELTVRAINRVFKVFPHLKTTRFAHRSDFYSLVAVFQRMEADGFVMNNAKRNRLAGEILTAFGAGVDDVRVATKRGFGARADQELFRGYLETVLEGTDEIKHRQARDQLLMGLLSSLFERRDAKRLFSPEQRRILWASTAERRCVQCKRSLTWDDLTIDHITPHVRGDKTRLENAAMMCRAHNSSKGSRRAA